MSPLVVDSRDWLLLLDKIVQPSYYCLLTHCAANLLNTTSHGFYQVDDIDLKTVSNFHGGYQHPACVPTSVSSPIMIVPLVGFGLVT